MNSKMVVFILFSIFISLSLSIIFPFSNFNKKSILLPKQEQIINDKYEQEPRDIKKYNNKNKIYNFDWFGVVDNYFEKFKTVKVIDVKTSKSFNVQRVGGVNHAEVETISVEETKKVKSILKNGWSWERRPVIVVINKTYIAASISLMPHGYNVLDNNLSGHFCMHFLNSKTHGTNKIDYLHQKAILYAKKRGLKALF